MRCEPVPTRRRGRAAPTWPRRGSETDRTALPRSSRILRLLGPSHRPTLRRGAGERPIAGVTRSRRRAAERAGTAPGKRAGSWTGRARSDLTARLKLLHRIAARASLSPARYYALSLLAPIHPEEVSAACARSQKSSQSDHRRRCWRHGADRFGRVVKLRRSADRSAAIGHRVRDFVARWQHRQVCAALAPSKQ